NEICLNVAEIYLGLSQYDKANAMYGKINLAALNASQRTAVQSLVFRTQQKLGNANSVLTLAGQILGDSQGAPTMKARSYDVMARKAYQNNDKDQLTQLEHQVLNLDQREKAVKDTLSYIGFLRA